MNIIFHTTTAIGLTVSMIDTDKINESTKMIKVVGLCFILFLLGIVFHGVIDYIPHCYPINSKLDVLFGLTMIVILVLIFRNKYKLLIGCALFGSIFPDLIDLLPSILDKYCGQNIRMDFKIFPWHWKIYSGSIYNGNCDISTLNQIFLIFTICIICWFRKKDLIKMIKYEY